MDNANLLSLLHSHACALVLHFSHREHYFSQIMKKNQQVGSQRCANTEMWNPHYLAITNKQTNSSLKCEFILSQLALPSLIVGFRKWLLAILCCTIKHINFALLKKPNLTKNCIDKAKNQTNTSLPPMFPAFMFQCLHHNIAAAPCGCNHLLGPLN